MGRRQKKLNNKIKGKKVYHIITLTAVYEQLDILIAIFANF